MRAAGLFGYVAGPCRLEPHRGPRQGGCQVRMCVCVFMLLHMHTCVRACVMCTFEHAHLHMQAVHIGRVSALPPSAHLRVWPCACRHTAAAIAAAGAVEIQLRGRSPLHRAASAAPAMHSRRVQGAHARGGGCNSECCLLHGRRAQGPYEQGLC